MISRQNLITQLETNNNFKSIPLPHGKFTQPTTKDILQMDKARLHNIRDELTNKTSLPDIIGQITPETLQDWLKPKYTKNANNDVMQSGTISAADMLQQSANNQITYGAYMSFKENEKITLPQMILPLFSLDKQQQQSGMLYGMRNPDSFYKCILLLSNASYIINTKYKRDQDVLTLKTTISNAAKTIYDQLNYISKLSNIPCTAQALSNAITKENHTEPGVFQCCADYLEHPIYIVNMDDKKIHHYRCLDTQFDTRPGYVIVNYQGCYLPFYHAETQHLVNIPLELMKQHGFRECNTDNPDTKYGFYILQQLNNESNNISTTKLEQPNKVVSQEQNITLTSISQEKIIDLQTKAKLLGISIQKPNKKGKMINKLKAELYSDIENALKK